VEEAVALRALLAGEPVELGAATRLLRTQETLAVALEGCDIPRIVASGLDEIGFGSYEGGPLEAYRTWAWTHEPDAPCPGGGESRAEAAARIAGGLDELLARPEDVVLAVSHALPIRYVLDGAVGRIPVPRIEPVLHATPYALEGESVERAAGLLRAWAAAPRWHT
jgi:probable phosphoglycerate mutase